MPEQKHDATETLALNTQVEAAFVSPLTAVRSALEILRDFRDISEDDHQSFVLKALDGCARLEAGIESLASSVYAAGYKETPTRPHHIPNKEYDDYQNRLTLLHEAKIIEIDFSNFVFKNSETVNNFFDIIDETIENTGIKWYIVVNSKDCRVWPEAWVAYAHRGKKINKTYSLGTVRYAAQTTNQSSAPLSDNLAPHYASSRESALALIQTLKQGSL